jgi:hypothetical protein
MAKEVEDKARTWAEILSGLFLLMDVGILIFRRARAIYERFKDELEEPRYEFQNVVKS